jgi:hypothetical protein
VEPRKEEEEEEEEEDARKIGHVVGRRMELDQDRARCRAFLLPFLKLRFSV